MMCKASMAASRTRDAQKGDRLVFDQSRHGLPMVRREGDGRDFPTCLKIGRKMRIVNIPLSIQDAINVGSEIEGMFVEEVDDYSDQIRLSDGRVLDLFHFVGIDDPSSMIVEIGDPAAPDVLEVLVDELSGREAAWPEPGQDRGTNVYMDDEAAGMPELVNN